MKTVKLVGLMAGPKGVFQPGSILELTDAEADHLVRTGQAKLISGAKPVNKAQVADAPTGKNVAAIEPAPAAPTPAAPADPTPGTSDAPKTETDEQPKGDAPAEGSGDAPKENVEGSATEEAAAPAAEGSEAPAPKGFDEFQTIAELDVSLAAHDEANK